jgi:hypothetical protein
MERLLGASQILLEISGSLTVTRYRLLVCRRILALRRLLLPEIRLRLTGYSGILLRLLRRVGASLSMILARPRSLSHGPRNRLTACLYLLGRGDCKPLIGKKGNNAQDKAGDNPIEI